MVTRRFDFRSYQGLKHYVPPPPYPQSAIDFYYEINSSSLTKSAFWGPPPPCGGNIRMLPKGLSDPGITMAENTTTATAEITAITEIIETVTAITTADPADPRPAEEDTSTPGNSPARIGNSKLIHKTLIIKQPGIK